MKLSSFKEYVTTQTLVINSDAVLTIVFVAKSASGASGDIIMY